MIFHKRIGDIHMSTSTKAYSATAAALLDFVKGLKSSIQLDKSEMKTTKDINPLSGKPYTSKDKLVLGIPDDHSIIWSQAHFDKPTYSRIVGLSKAIDRPVATMVAEIVMDWVDKNYDAIDEISSAYLASEQTEEDIKKKMESAKRQLERLQALLESKS